MLFFSFSVCHEELDPDTYFKSCVNDLCLCTYEDLSRCLCPIVADYGLACAKKGVIVNWVDDIATCSKF